MMMYFVGVRKCQIYYKDLGIDILMVNWLMAKDKTVRKLHITLAIIGLVSDVASN